MPDKILLGGSAGIGGLISAAIVYMGFGQRMKRSEKDIDRLFELHEKQKDSAVPGPECDAKMQGLTSQVSEIKTKTEKIDETVTAIYREMPKRATE